MVVLDLGRGGAPRPPSTTTCSCATTPSPACCRAAGCAWPIRRPRCVRPSCSCSPRPAPRAGRRLRCSNPARRWPRRQVPGRVFTGRFPAFTTRLAFDPARLDAARLDVISHPAGRRHHRQCRLRRRAAARRVVLRRRQFPQAGLHRHRFRALSGNRYAADGSPVAARHEQTGHPQFTWTPGARLVLAGRPRCRGWRSAWRRRLGHTALIPDAIAISTRVVFAPGSDVQRAARNARTRAASNGQSSSRSPAASRSTGTRRP